VALNMFKNMLLQSISGMCGDEQGRFSEKSDKH
jgi:hypothetical protein